MPDGSKHDPIHLVFDGSSDLKAATLTALLIAVPVTIALLYRHPEVRQRIIMTSSRKASAICFDLGEYFHGLGLKSATIYQKAKL